MEVKETIKNAGKNKAIDFFHNQTEIIAVALKIRILKRKSFKLYFTKSFDLFNDKTQVKYIQVLNFTKEELFNLNTYTYENGICQLFDLYKRLHSTTFDDLELKAVLYSSFFEVLCLYSFYHTTAVDLFKRIEDLTTHEKTKKKEIKECLEILEFVKENAVDLNSKSSTHEFIENKLFDLYKQSHSTILEDLHLRAVISASLCMRFIYNKF